MQHSKRPLLWLSLASYLAFLACTEEGRPSGDEVGTSLGTSEDESDADESTDEGDTTDTTTDTTDTGDDGLVWPNPEAPANSDPWLVEHHDEITELHPRVLALNFVNAKSMADMQGLLEQIVAGFAEGSRYHGYADPSAPAVLHFELAYLVDLRDASPPPNWPYNNSTLYPREDPQEGYWSFDYEQLFTEQFAARYGIVDPNDPDAGPLPLCELVERGLVHEVWVYGDADVPDVTRGRGARDQALL
ncbi:MAG: hypothetical protein HC927_13150 [Deltaproteobacteria bacterium]|nr:hypothetical protein [Deltaproteobacteria bacterium]